MILALRNYTIAGACCSCRCTCKGGCTFQGLDLQRLGLQRLDLQRLGPSKAGPSKAGTKPTPMRMEKAATEKRTAELAKPQPQREKRQGRMGAFVCLTHFACSRCALLLGADIGLLWATKLRQRLGSFKGLDLQRLDLQRLDLQRLDLQRLDP